MLIEYDLFGKKTDKVQQAVDLLRQLERPDGYYVAFSGGKDSQCVYHLFQMAGVKFDAHYSVTTVDPPELVQFIKTHYSGATEYEWICPACGTSILVKTFKQSKAIGMKLSVCPVCGKEILYGKAD